MPDIKQLVLVWSIHCSLDFQFQTWYFHCNNQTLWSHLQLKKNKPTTFLVLRSKYLDICGLLFAQTVHSDIVSFLQILKVSPDLILTDLIQSSVVDAFSPFYLFLLINPTSVTFFLFVYFNDLWKWERVKRTFSVGHLTVSPAPLPPSILQTGCLNPMKPPHKLFFSFKGMTSFTAELAVKQKALF